VRDAIAREIPDAEVLTATEFAIRSVSYWLLETGAGISVVVTAALGLMVGAFVTSQNLFAITQEHITNYATLSALGFGRRQLTEIVLAQSLFLGAGGIVLGSLLFLVGRHFSQTTPIPLETTPLVFGGLAALSALSCVLASLASIRSIFRIDPVSVFRV
jgi:putative ABC transport system permease protein